MQLTSPNGALPAAIRYCLMMVLALCAGQLFAATNPGAAGPYSTAYGSYNSSTPGAPQTVDIRSYFNAPDPSVTKVLMNAAPLNAEYYYPTNAVGKLPIVIVVHGNNLSAQTYAGYRYLLQHLASHGMIAVSINIGFLNGATYGEIDARAYMALQHLRKWRSWSQTVGHAFYNRVDLTKVGLVGQSRGGEAVTVAHVFNTKLHNAANPATNFNFGIKALMAIAPTDGAVLGNDHPFCPPSCVDPTPGYNPQWGEVIVRGTAYLLLQGGHDGDTYRFPGQRTYDRAHPVYEVASGYKAMAFVHEANHAYFNTVWTSNCTAAGNCHENVTPSNSLIGPAKQQSIAKTYAAALFLNRLKGVADVIETMRGTYYFGPGVVVVPQFQSQNRIFLSHFQEDGNPNTGSYPGSSNNDMGFFGPSLAVYEQVSLDTWSTFPHGYQQTNAAMLGWTNQAGYAVNVGSTFTTLDASKLGTTHKHLVFRVGQVYQNTPYYNTLGANQNFSVVLNFGGNASYVLPISNYRALPYPDRATKLGSGSSAVDITKTIMTTVRIPLRHFVTSDVWDWKTLTQIQFRFDRTYSGLVVIDDIQFSD